MANKMNGRMWMVLVIFAAFACISLAVPMTVNANDVQNYSVSVVGYNSSGAKKSETYRNLSKYVCHKPT